MHLDSVFFLLLIGVAAVLRWLSQRGDERKRDEPPDPGRTAPPARADSQSEEERIRRFMEALGQPAGAQPPPKVQPRRVSPPAKVETAPQKPVRRRVVLTPTLPPLTTAPPDLPTAPPPLAQPAGERPLVEVMREVPRRAAKQAPITTAPGTSAAGSFAQLQARLTTPEALREAIVLREIFGPPRALQSVGEFPI